MQRKGGCKKHFETGKERKRDAKKKSNSNGTSGNVSVTSCEMAVRSDRSEKVHGNIPHLAPTISSVCRPS